MFLYIHWSPDPELIEIGSFAIRWYGLFFATGFYIGYMLMQRFFRKEGIPQEALDKLTYYMVFATIIGARLGHCLFYEPDFYLSHPVEMLKVWKGGLASHGAAIAIPAALWLYSRRVSKRPALWILDRIVITVALAGSLIRLGNLMNSEIVGAPTSVPWAFVFERVDSQPRHPAQIYESLSYMLIFIYLYRSYYRLNGRIPLGRLMGMFLTLVFSARFVLEFTKAVQVAFEKGMPLNMGQLLSLPFIALGIFLWVRSHRMPAEGVAVPKSSGSRR
jgi:prolipoprotein diacylglyceryl transferase